MVNSSLNNIVDYSSSDDEEVLHLSRTRCARQASPEAQNLTKAATTASVHQRVKMNNRSRALPLHTNYQPRATRFPMDRTKTVRKPTKRKRTAYALPMDQLHFFLRIPFIEAYVYFLKVRRALARVGTW